MVRGKGNLYLSTSFSGVSKIKCETRGSKTQSLSPHLIFRCQKEKMWDERLQKSIFTHLLFKCQQGKMRNVRIQKKNIYLPISFSGVRKGKCKTKSSKNQYLSTHFLFRWQQGKIWNWILEISVFTNQLPFQAAAKETVRREAWVTDF